MTEKNKEVSTKNHKTYINKQQANKLEHKKMTSYDLLSFLSIFSYEKTVSFHSVREKIKRKTEN